MSAYHQPVLLNESVDALDIVEGGVYVDATLGGGGHTREILSRLSRKGRLIVFDKDADAIANAPADKRVISVRSDFRFIENFVRYYGFNGIDGAIADLGVSSHQFDTPERGFSFRFDADLDMRMNTLAGISAKDVLNEYEERKLAEIFRLYGEINNAGRITKMICDARKNAEISTTGDLHNILEKALPPTGEHKFLAKIYQALRIEVNGEMSSLEHFLNGACRSLKPGGILSIITYHSLEDRMVKNFIRSGKIDGKVEKDIYGNEKTPMETMTHKPILPSEEEIHRNTRARSAKLRIGRKKEEI